MQKLQRHRLNDFCGRPRRILNLFGCALLHSFMQDQRHRIDCLFPKLRHVLNLLGVRRCTRSRGEMPSTASETTMISGISPIPSTVSCLMAGSSMTWGTGTSISRPVRHINGDARLHAGIVNPMPEEAPTSAVPWALRGMPAQRNRFETIAKNGGVKTTPRVQCRDADPAVMKATCQSEPWLRISAQSLDHVEEGTDGGRSC